MTAEPRRAAGDVPLHWSGQSGFTETGSAKLTGAGGHMGNAWDIL